MGYKGTPWSKGHYYKRLKRAKQLGCSIYDVPDRRGKHGNHKKGNEHPRWNSGKIISDEGYVKVRVGRNHPLSDPNGYAYEHLVVWTSAGNEPPKEGEILHHKNEDKTDNRLKNLEKMTRADHNKIHNKNKERNEVGQFT